MENLQLIGGLILGALIGVLAWKANLLTTSGAFAAAIIGGLIFWWGGFQWAFLLLAFFLSSSALSRAFSGRKMGLSEKFSKGSRRDWGQVLANGGLGTTLVIIQTLLPGQTWPWLAFAGSMAAVNADTWATELGVLSSAAPRLITSGKPVEKGASGGISSLGILASLGGAAFIGALTVWFGGPGRTRTPTSMLALLGVIVLGGFAGSLFDSLLGATIQAIYICPTCDKETEHHPRHTCGTSTHKIRGWAWLNNDVVNAMASAVGALVAGGGLDFGTARMFSP